MRQESPLDFTLRSTGSRESFKQEKGIIPSLCGVAYGGVESTRVSRELTRTSVAVEPASECHCVGQTMPGEPKVHNGRAREGRPGLALSPLSDLSVELLVGPVLSDVVEVAVKVHKVLVGPAV